MRATVTGHKDYFHSLIHQGVKLGNYYPDGHTRIVVDDAFSGKLVIMLETYDIEVPQSILDEPWNFKGIGPQRIKLAEYNTTDTPPSASYDNCWKWHYDPDPPEPELEILLEDSIDLSAELTQ